MGKHPLCRYAIMGIYINRGNMSFVGARRGEYVDKSELILYINSTLTTESRMTCVSRARRFGKSMAAEMLYAYDNKTQKVHIPNQEVRAELLQVVKTETRMLTTEVSLQS